MGPSPLDQQPLGCVAIGVAVSRGVCIEIIPSFSFVSYHNRHNARQDHSLFKPKKDLLVKIKELEDWENYIKLLLMWVGKFNFSLCEYYKNLPSSRIRQGGHVYKLQFIFGIQVQLSRGWGERTKSIY